MRRASRDDEISIRAVSELPRGIGELRAEAVAEGHRILGRLVENWESGENRFAGPGEVLLEARDREGTLLGIGGLNIDPFTGDRTVGRVRHLYVAAPARRRGIGRRLLAALIDRARGSFQRVRLRTFDPGAVRFYVAQGFDPIDEVDATHHLRP